MKAKKRSGISRTLSSISLQPERKISVRVHSSKPKIYKLGVIPPWEAPSIPSPPSPPQSPQPMTESLPSQPMKESLPSQATTAIVAIIASKTHGKNLKIMTPSQQHVTKTFSKHHDVKNLGFSRSSSDPPDAQNKMTHRINPNSHSSEDIAENDRTAAITRRVTTTRPKSHKQTITDKQFHQNPPLKGNDVSTRATSRSVVSVGGAARWSVVNSELSYIMTIDLGPNPLSNRERFLIIANVGHILVAASVAQLGGVGLAVISESPFDLSRDRLVSVCCISILFFLTGAHGVYTTARRKVQQSPAERLYSPSRSDGWKAMDSLSQQFTIFLGIILGISSCAAGVYIASSSTLALVNRLSSRLTGLVIVYEAAFLVTGSIEVVLSIGLVLVAFILPKWKFWTSHQRELPRNANKDCTDILKVPTVQLSSINKRQGSQNDFHNCVSHPSTGDTQSEVGYDSIGAADHQRTGEQKSIQKARRRGVIFFTLLNCTHILLGLCVAELSVVGLIDSSRLTVGPLGLAAALFSALMFVTTGVWGLLHDFITRRPSSKAALGSHVMASVLSLLTASAVLALNTNELIRDSYYTGLPAVVVFDAFLLAVISVEALVSIVAIGTGVIRCTIRRRANADFDNNSEVLSSADSNVTL